MPNPISQVQLQMLRGKLEERRSQLRTDQQDEKYTSERTQSDSQDIETSYVSDQDKKVDKEVNEQHILELRNIDAALQRMDSGHYGVCQDCGEMIDIERLSAYPVARLCIDCKQALEHESGIDRNN